MKTSYRQPDSFVLTTTKKTWLRGYVPGLYLLLFFLWCAWMPLQMLLYLVSDKPTVETSFLFGRSWWGVVVEFSMIIVGIGFMPICCGYPVARIAWNDAKTYEGRFAAWQEKNAGCPPSLDDITKAAGKRGLSHTDPWGNDYVVFCPGSHEADLDVCSNGPDKQPGTEDDICSWQPQPRR